MDTLARNNVKILGGTAGAGTEVLLLAHGFGCDQSMWRLVAPELAHHRRVVLYDLVGAGGSDLSAYDEQRHSTLDGYADDLIEVIAALGLGPVVYVGHSVSAMIGVLAAVRRPDLFAKLILVAPSPYYLNEPATGYCGGFEQADIDGLLEMMNGQPEGWAGFLTPLVMQNPDRPELADELRGRFCSIDPRIARQFAAVTFGSDTRAELSKVTVPALILQCAADVIAPYSVGVFVHEQIPGSRLHLMEAIGHCPHLSHPAETIKVIRDYLDGLS